MKKSSVSGINDQLELEVIAKVPWNFKSLDVPNRTRRSHIMKHVLANKRTSH